ncbi:MAG TPA: LysM peptidoglycan-binding domain-containing M23 family metallopeptidase [Candidatus Sulfotelmatobacter sp.]|jgi:murein DD-endopeptidase MepM/ murein hydrolase activator NlpD|nr:LysM peptidoglycan-binding domain-containing M23 family metallopeptidase [Candidatus Sulfotelmatobacter sp.]
MSRLQILSRFAFVAAIGLLAAGCSMTPGPGTGVDYRQGGNVDRSTSNGTYVVQRGDTIYGVARQFNMSVRALIDANNLQPPYQLTVGQLLYLSTTREYVVVKGDSLLTISRKTGVPYATLARMNNITDPNLIKVGQKLKLPTTGQAAPVDTAARAPAAAPVTSAPLPEQKPDTKKGGYATLAEREKVAEPPPPPPPAPPAQQPAASAPATASASSAPAPTAQAPAQTASAAAPAPIQAPPPKSGKGFVWPVKGEVISEFGNAGKGVHNDGINIAVPKGSSVVAAEDGVVAYSGNELRGFGNLLLIKHADGWMTAYAHNDQLLVKRGETVKRGQKIALSGDSGGVTQPQLHFELRQGTRAVDPETMLKD